MRTRLLVLLILLGALALAWTLGELYRPYRGYSGNLVVVIEPKTRATAVARLLVERGVLARRLPFLLRYWAGRASHPIRAGEYLFDRPLRPLDVYRKLVLGDVYLHPVVIPEGSDRFDIARILHEQLGLPPEEFLRLTRETAAIRDLDPQAPTLEGYLFPDTYRFPRGVSSASVVAAMLPRFRHVLDSKFGAQLRSSPTRLHDRVTLASLLEKETPEPAERPVIAGVFQRRLQKGMPLQCDPTVVYADRLNRNCGAHPTAPITQSELNLESPYNTYRHSGLPPGPICNPGEVSLRAAWNPTPGDPLYFVSNNRGGHVFARTLAEHQRNVARYRREVAALHPAASEGTKRPGQPPPTLQPKASTTTSRSAKDGKGQKANHPRVLPGKGSETHRSPGNPGHRG
jgi:UPF0755 protein